LTSIYDVLLLQSVASRSDPIRGTPSLSKDSDLSFGYSGKILCLNQICRSLYLPTCLTMSSREDRILRELYGGKLEHAYHQEAHRGYFGWHTSVGLYITVFMLIPGLVYTALYALDFDLLSLPGLLWNCLVYITPSRLLDILDDDRKMSIVSDPTLSSIPRTHAAKNEVMRRLLGFDKVGGILGTVAARRQRFSALSGMNMIVQREDGRPPGLGNWDNSCYQNSVLQGLASLDSFLGFLADPALSHALGEVAESSHMKMVGSLRSLISCLKDPSNNGKRIWTPATLKSMSSWQQQDAQEYFSKVLDELDKEIVRATRAQESLPGLESQQDINEVTEGHSRILSLRARTKIKTRNPLEGLLAQRVGCTQCGFSDGLSLIPFNCLTVQLGRRYYYDLHECLDEYTKLELIEGVECGKCTLLKSQRLLSIILKRIKDSPPASQVYTSTEARLKAVTEALEDDDYEDKTLTQKCHIPTHNRMSTIKSRQAIIARPPKSFVVHINRSLFDEISGELKKNHAEVRFPRRLDLGPWCLGSSGLAHGVHYEQWLLDPAQSMVAGGANPSSVHGPVYELRAVVTHYGKHENGHYVCYRKHPGVNTVDDEEPQKDRWWRFSDDDVMKVSEENVLAQGGVFMLFYDCVEQDAISSYAAEPVSTSDTSAEVAIAAKIALPAEIDDELDNSDSDELGSTTASGEQSAVMSTLGYKDDTHPKAIRIPPHIQSNGTYHRDESELGIRSSRNMVMV
jgi:ubiquitin carboxyl-terminal hydrolase 1